MNHLRLPSMARSLAVVLFVSLLVSSGAPAPFTVTVLAESPGLVISQVYGGGGNTGAPYRNDFVELFNRGSVAVSLAGKSIQYASATGTGNFGANPTTALSGTLAPGQYYLVQLAGGANGVPLPTPDAAGTANMSGTAGKVALVDSTAGLACNGGSTPCSPAQLALIVDLVGWGSANFYEGAAAPATSNTTALFRSGGGCMETDNNAADFTVAAPAPRNTASALFACSGPTNPTGTGAAAPPSVQAGADSLLTVAVTPGSSPASSGIAVSADLSAIGGSSAQAFFDDGTNGDLTGGDSVFSYNAAVASTTTPGSRSLPFTVSDGQSRSSSGSITLVIVPPPMPIHAIQGAGTTSPFVGQTVTTRGVVTARRFNNGFFVQTPDELADGDPKTSEAVFVFTSGAPAVTVGAYVEVTGTVFEFVPSSDPYSPPVTEITAPAVSALSTTYPMPLPVTLSAADLPASGTLEYLERLEGMRVYLPLLRTVSPTQGTIAESSATSTSNGVFYAVIDGVARPFREPGIQAGDPLPAGAPPAVPLFDGNPERLRVDSDGQFGAARIEVTSGALVSNVVGVLDFGFRTWTVLPDPSTPPAVSGGLTSAVPVPPPGDNEFTVGSYNLARFFDTINDPLIGEPVLTAPAFANRLNKASLAIRNVMLAPDIVGVEEVENLATLQALAAKINADAVAAGQPDPAYVAYLEEGNDIGGIDVGFLVKAARVNVIDVTQAGKDETYIDPTTGGAALLNDRPPLVLRVTVQGPVGEPFPVTAIVNHLRSLNGINDETTSGGATEGARVRAKRAAQAEFLANLIQERQAADPDERIVSVGDYNAFAVNDGYVDVIGTVEGRPTPADQVVLASPDLVNPDLTTLVDLLSVDQAYSYVFDGSTQALDHVQANASLMKRFTRFHYARNNADFPESYRNDPNRPERLSDHDMPVAYFAFPGAPTLTLNGPNPMSVECCTAFVDPGASAYDEDLGDLTSSIVVSGSVDAHTVGTYTLTYSVTNGFVTSTATRTVNVVDTTPPVVTLNGASPMTIELGGIYAEEGAVASDTCAGSLAVAIAGTVNTAAVGTYPIVYSASDGYNTTSVTRFVTVADTTPPSITAIAATPDMLWPPNGQFVAVTIGVTATDLGGEPSCRITQVASSEPGKPGGAKAAPDFASTGPLTLDLRADRDGKSSGRIYTMTITCADVSGNSSNGTARVTVPHDARRR